MHKASDSFINSKAIIILLEESEIKTEEGAFHIGYDYPVTLVSVTCKAARDFQNPLWTTLEWSGIQCHTPKTYALKL